MIPLLIFYLHIIAFTAAFTREYQKEGIGAGMLMLGFMTLIFSVGWSISTFSLKYLFAEAGFGSWLNRDAMSLLLLTIGEIAFYSFYFQSDKKEKARA